MRNKAGLKLNCTLEGLLDFIDIDYTHLNKTIRYEQRPQGEWIYDMFDENYHCSECNRVGAAIYHFCPNCGADMREGKAE